MAHLLINGDEIHVRRWEIVDEDTDTLTLQVWVGKHEWDNIGGGDDAD